MDNKVKIKNNNYNCRGAFRGTAIIVIVFKCKPKIRRPTAPQEKNWSFYGSFFSEEHVAEERQTEATLAMGTEVFFILIQGEALAEQIN